MSISSRRKIRRSLLCIVSKQGRDVLVDRVAGLGGCRSVCGVVSQSKVGRAWGRLPKVVLAGEERRGVGVVGNSLSRRLSVFGVGIRKQEGKRIVVGLVGVVKCEVVIVSITLNVVGDFVADRVALLSGNIQGMLLRLFWLWRT